MRLTIGEISKTLGLRKEVVMAALREIGHEPDETEVLETKEFVRLKRILFRYYQDALNRDTEEESLKSESDQDAELEKLVSGHHIMIDTCSLMHEGCEMFSDRILPLLKRYGKKIIIPEKVIQELRKHVTDKENAVKSANARKGLALCERFNKAGCLSVRGNVADNFADNTFYVSLSQYRFLYKMILITQDRNLTYDILQLNELKSSEGNTVRVFRITSTGDLMESI